MTYKHVKPSRLTRALIRRQQGDLTSALRDFERSGLATLSASKIAGAVLEKSQFSRLPDEFIGEVLKPFLESMFGVSGLVKPLPKERGGSYRHWVEISQEIEDLRVLTQNSNQALSVVIDLLGNDISSVIGGLILSMITNAALTRENLPQVRRKPFFVYVDELSMFTTDSIASMLSELRKYKISLCLAGQFLASIPITIREAILGNVGTILVFRLGVNDAILMSKQFGGIDSQNLINLPNYRMFCRLIVDGVQTKAFSSVTRIYTG